MSGPETIYLQDAGDYSAAAELEVTWCVDPQDPNDTKYIRADLHASAIARAELAEAERDRFEAALARACLVGGTTYLVERAERAGAEFAMARTDADELRVSLRKAEEAIAMAERALVEAERFRTNAMTHLRDNGEFFGRDELLSWGDGLGVRCRFALAKIAALKGGAQ